MAFFVADFINSDQILNEINFNGGVGLEARLGEKHLKDTEEVRLFSKWQGQIKFYRHLMN